VIQGKPGIRIEGNMSGREAGTRLAARVKSGKGGFATVRASIVVKSDGSFIWQSRTNKKSTVIIQSREGAVQSNPVTIKPLR
jgi:hypothetical protein